MRELEFTPLTNVGKLTSTDYSVLSVRFSAKQRLLADRNQLRDEQATATDETSCRDVDALYNCNHSMEVLYCALSLHMGLLVGGSQVRNYSISLNNINQNLIKGILFR